MKRFIIFSALIAVVLSFGACSNKQERKTQLKVVYKDENTRWITDTAKEYEKSHPDVKINLQFIGGTAENYYTKTAILLRSDASTDVVFQDGFLLNKMVESNMLAPINEVKEWSDWNQYYPVVQRAVEINNNVYAIPISVDVRGLYYNKKLFQKLNIKTPWQPKNWNDILSAAKKVQAYGHKVIPFGVGVTKDSEQTTMQTFEMLLYGTDSPLYKDGKWVVKSKGILASLNFIAKIFKENLGPGIRTATDERYSDLMFESIAADKRVGIFLDGCWAMNVWKHLHPHTLYAYDFVPMPTQKGQKPGYTSMTGGWGFVVSEKSSNKQAALDFIKFASSHENYLKLAQLDWKLIPRKDVLNSPDLPDELQPLIKILDYSHFRPANSNYPLVSEYISEMVNAVATQELTPKKAMDKFAAEVNDSLRGHTVSIENK